MPLEQSQTEVAPLSFQLKGGDLNQFTVVQYRGSEGMCQLYRFEIEAICADNDLDLEKIVGVEGCLGLNRWNDLPEGQPRYFHGVVSRIELCRQTNQSGYYRIELVPKLWLLTHRSGSRVFQNKTVKQIVEEVLTGAGIAADRLSVNLQGRANTVQREYCTQYRETDYNFICRLLEAEGVWWYFKHLQDKHILVIADAKAAYAPIPGDAPMTCKLVSAMQGSGSAVYHFRRGVTTRPSVAALNDFNFENPALDLKAKKDLGRDAGLEFHDYPGEYAAQSDGTAIAEIRAQEFECQRQRATGHTDSVRLGPAVKFTLADHPTMSVNGEYVVTAITHRGWQPTQSAHSAGNGLSDKARHLLAQNEQNLRLRDVAAALLELDGRLQFGDPTARRELTHWLYHAGQVVRDPASAAAALGGNPLAALSISNLLDDPREVSPQMQTARLGPYECTFECLPATVEFRPPRITPWPVMRGAQTAIVCGGEEIETDAHGRIKIRFHWDPRNLYDNTVSCWVRVAQGMAGGGYGSLFLPRKGQEVIVDFLEGNPDKPIVVGRVYNNDHKPAYTLPDEKNRSYIKTQSVGGGGTNEIRFDDTKDSEQVLIYAQKDLHVRSKNEQRHMAEKDVHLIVKGEHRAKLDKHRSVDVGGKDALHVKETRSVKVDDDVYEDYQKNHDHKVASEYHLKAKSIIVEADDGIGLKVGGNFISIAKDGVYIKGSMVYLNSGGMVAPSSVQAQLASPAAPEEAEQAQPGTSKEYSGAAQEQAALAEKPYEGHWISFDLKDDETEEPVAGEYYEVIKPSGKKVKGTLDVNGFARLWVDEPGECQITFPNRDATEWQPG